MGIPTKIWIYPYTIAREFVPEACTIAIRIFDPGETKLTENVDVPLMESELWLAELKYTFADLDPTVYEMNGQKDIAEQMFADPRCFNSKLAEDIIHDFEMAFFGSGLFGEGSGPENYQQIMLHCNAGLSRSPAVARALCEVFDLDPIWMPKRDYMMKNGHRGNLWVYNTLRNEI